MSFIRDSIEFIFSIALFINALLFIPQAIRIIKEKNAKDVSITTFLGFLVIQFSIVLHAAINHDFLLLSGYLVSMLTCGSVVILIVIYRKPSNSIDSITLEEIIAQLPEHVYWKDKDCNSVGSNTNNWKDFGLKSYADYKGKNDYDLFPKEQADHIKNVDDEVIRTGKEKIIEEPAIKSDGTLALYLSHKVPLKNKKDQIIGVLGISVDITHAKQEIEDKLDMLENIIAVMPGHVYWVSKEGHYLGCNENQAKSAGLASRKEIIGKRNSDLPWNFNAGTLPEELDRVNEEVMEAGKAKLLEEPATLKDGSKVMFLSNKAPLYNSRGEVMGMVGVSLDITDRKEKERLLVETEVQKALLEEQKENQETINKYAHDVRSPVSGAMMILNQCIELPEDKRVPLRKALMRISDMTKNLLRKYNASNDSNITEERKPVLVADALLDLLTEKRFEYEKLPVKFEHHFKDYFAFIRIEPNAFKRTISNLINNAVDALEGKDGVITLNLETLKDKVKIVIQDNGKGMPPEVVEKLMNNMEVTYDKEDGHGIGFKQVHKTLQDNQGGLEVDSKAGRGTKITLTFPKIKAPDWSSVGSIVLGGQDILVILDDEDSVKEAWRIHLEPILKTATGIEIHFFKIGSEALDFINKLDTEKKSRVFLLTDFELLNQDLNGLDVVEQSHVHRSLLVTSHSTHPGIQERAIRLGTKILPKALAAEDIPIHIDENFKYAIANHEDNSNSQSPEAAFKKVDIVIVDDDEEFANTLKNFLFIGKLVDCYYHPQKFLEQISQYPKDTKICLDNNFVDAGGMTGLKLAEQLYNMGYSKLYLLSGDDFKKDEIPSYLTAILKTDFENIQKI